MRVLEPGVRLLVFRDWFVRAMFGVEAGIWQAQPFDGTAVEEMLGDDLLDVFDVDEAVPDGLGIDHDDGAMLALVEAAGFVGPDMVFEASVFDGVLEGGFELFASVGKATGAGGAFVALVGADKDVMIEFRHYLCSPSLMVDGRAVHRAF
jgi:hypothetical protein